MNDGSPDDFAPPLDRDGSPLRNAALEAAMREVALHDSARSRGLLYQLLLDALVIVMVPEGSGGRGERTIGAGEEIALLTLPDQEGPTLPVFTNPDAVRAWRPEGGAVLTMPARSVVEMAAAQGEGRLVINPGSPTWGVVTHRELRALAQGRMPMADGSEVVTEQTEVTFGVPKVLPPEDVLEAVRSALAAEATVQVAWLFLIQQGTAPAEHAIGVAFAPEPDDPRHRRAMRAVVDDAGRRCEGARILCFLVADDAWQQPLANGSGIELFRRATAEPQRRARRWPWRR